MTKTPKAYRDDLSKDLWVKRKDTNEKIKRIQENPDFLEAHKEEAIKVVKDKLYKELDDARATEEYKDAELATMSEEYGEKTEKKESKESKESPRKALEKERKTAAIAELDRLGMKTEENVKKINAIQFLDDKILIGNTPWAYENMTGSTGIFRKETNRHYYNFAERKAEAENPGITLPEKKDFENTLKALPGEYSESSWYKGGNILSIILGESMTGYCDNGGNLHCHGEYGCLGSVSLYDEDSARVFGFGRDGGTLHCDFEHSRFVCRPLVKNS